LCVLIKLLASDSSSDEMASEWATLAKTTRARPQQEEVSPCRISRSGKSVFLANRNLNAWRKTAFCQIAATIGMWGAVLLKHFCQHLQAVAPAQHDRRFHCSVSKPSRRSHSSSFRRGGHAWYQIQTFRLCLAAHGVRVFSWFHEQESIGGTNVRNRNRYQHDWTI
jgi:hypothetical protein